MVILLLIEVIILIFDTLLNILLYVPEQILSAMPEVSISTVPIPVEFTEWFVKMFEVSQLFFPMELLSYIIETMLALRLARLNVAGFKFIKSNIPGLS